MDSQVKGIFSSIREQYKDVFELLSAEDVNKIGQLAASYISRFRAITGPQWNGPVTSSRKSGGGASGSKGAALGFSVPAACLDLAVAYIAQHPRKGLAPAERDGLSRLQASSTSLSSALQKKAAVPTKLYKDILSSVKAELGLDSRSASTSTPLKRKASHSRTPDATQPGLTKRSRLSDKASHSKSKRNDLVGVSDPITPTKIKPSPSHFNQRDTGLGFNGGITTVSSRATSAKKSERILYTTDGITSMMMADINHDDIFSSVRELSIEPSIPPPSTQKSRRRPRRWTLPRSICSFLQLSELDRRDFNKKSQEALEVWKGEMLQRIMG